MRIIEKAQRKIHNLLGWGKLVDKLDELFPKGECQERGQAMVLLAFFQMFLEAERKEWENEEKRISNSGRKLYQLGRKDYKKELLKAGYDEISKTYSPDHIFEKLNEK